MPFPFGAPILEQVESLEQNLELLRAFAEKHPDLECWAATPLGPTIYFSSDSAPIVRSRLGSAGWHQEQTLLWKELDGIRFELRMPTNNFSKLVSI
jgi:hypothetical protein